MSTATTTTTAKAPVVDRRRLEQQVPFMEQDREIYCLVTSLCGFVMLHPGMNQSINMTYITVVCFYSSVC